VCFDAGGQLTRLDQTLDGPRNVGSHARQVPQSPPPAALQQHVQRFFQIKDHIGRVPVSPDPVKVATLGIQLTRMASEPIGNAVIVHDSRLPDNGNA
jgi:hypothetical protein